MQEVTVITGTRKGIGKDLCNYYLAKGHIVAGCSRGESTIIHENYIHYVIDIADEKAVVHMIADIRRQFGRIDVLLNNAGIASMNHLLMTPYSTLEDIFKTNVFGTFIFIREASKVMMKNKYGRIVNFVTVATPLRLAGEAAYSASKASIVNLTEVAAKELANFNITVNAIGPTPVPTDLIKNIPKDKMNLLLDRQVIKRYGEINDIVNVIDFFINRRSDFITGQVLYLGGVHY